METQHETDKRVRLAIAVLAALASVSRRERSPRRSPQAAPPRPPELQLVEATIPQLQQAMQSGLLTAEQLVRLYRAASPPSTRRGRR